MSERYKNRRYPGELHSLKLQNVDVRVWSRLTQKPDKEAAQDLITMQFQGEEIRREATRSVTRRQAAEKIFQGYLK